jgi:hypothetical protein
MATVGFTIGILSIIVARKKKRVARSIMKAGRANLEKKNLMIWGTGK